MRVLGIDPGRKRVGLATGDELFKIATGYRAILRKSDPQLISEIQKIISEEEIELIVMGLPKNMDGSEGGSAKKSRFLADALKKKTEIDVVFVDERLSTVEATRQLHSAEGKTGKSKEVIDILAATLILQTYFDSLD